MFFGIVYDRPDDVGDVRVWLLAAAVLHHVVLGPEVLQHELSVLLPNRYS